MECCICLETPETVESQYADSFIKIPCGGKHVVCFDCFLRNENKKCPMCRHDYALKIESRVNTPRIDIDFNSHDYVVNELNIDIETIDNWYRDKLWLAYYMIDDIENRIFLQRLNIDFDFETLKRAIIRIIEMEAFSIVDLEPNYDICARMYLTHMLVAYSTTGLTTISSSNEIVFGEEPITAQSFNQFVLSVNDFIQHEIDNVEILI